MITWSEFENSNKNHQTAFENMCRMLFKKRFFDHDVILHSNPNNPGIEVEPVIGKDGKRISFQAKYFEANTHYPSLVESCKKTCDHYSGLIDIVYVYCNNDLDSNSKQYIKCVGILNSIGAELIPITNQEILEQAQTDKVVMAGYFSGIALDEEWFDTKKEAAIKRLGHRYNREFSIEMEAERQLDVFTCSQQTCEEYKKTINDLLDSMNEFHWKWNQQFRDKVRNEILGFKASSFAGIPEYQRFSSSIIELCTSELNALKEKNNDLWKRIIEKEGKIDELRYDYSTVSRLYQRLSGTVTRLIYLNNNSKAKIAIVKGESGVGKSHIFARMVDLQKKAGQQRLLITGNSFAGNEQVSVQFSHALLSQQKDMSVLFDAFECIAQQKNNITVVFIDAINESKDWGIWDSGLDQILELLDERTHVKVAISLRSETEDILIPSARNHVEKIIQVINSGFDTTDIEQYCLHYGVPMVPTDLLNDWMGNPLLLSLYCQLNDYTNKNQIDIYEMAIELWDAPSKKAIGNTTKEKLLKKFLNDYLDLMIRNRETVITREDVFSIESLKGYSIEKKWDYIAALESCGLLISNETHYFLTYNKMQDYFVAKRLVDQSKSADDVIAAVKDLLDIKDGRTSGYGYAFLSIVPFVSLLCYKKYKQECVNAIIDSIKDHYEKDQIIDDYVETFEWRSPSDFNADTFVSFINSYRVCNEKMYNVLVFNGAKPDHPFNARYLDEHLQNMRMPERDACWTMYLNESMFSDSPRLIRIIELYTIDENIAAYYDDQQLMLALTMFGWVLTSSNRYLRDNCSKAMIAILSNRLNLCLPMLRKFENVNDPYVLQRMMGVVLGAVLRRKKAWEDEFGSIAEYVYRHVFEQDEVYPDVLYREYARLIIERWIFENPNQTEFLKDVFSPPYNAKDIPAMEKPVIIDGYDGHGGTYCILSSMRTTCDGAGMYGDFGRYIFESALMGFKDVDVLNAEYYAINYVFDELGYSDALFGHDTRPFEREPRSRISSERIGKKYQWIALYNTIARIADNHGRTDDCWGSDLWGLNIRDFDPTLTNNGTNLPSIPEFDRAFSPEDSFICYDKIDQEADIVQWIEAKSNSFELSENRLIYTDKNEEDWVVLGQYQTMNTERYPKPFSNGGPEVWRHAFAYFIPAVKQKRMIEEFSGKNFMGRWFPEALDIDDVFIREYYWSSIFDSAELAEWKEIEVETGETVKRTYESTEQMKELHRLIRQIETGEDEPIQEDEGDVKTVDEPIMQVIGKVLPAFIDASWSNEYDASKNNEFRFLIPCKEIADYLGLYQKEDGFFYIGDELVAFDSNIAGLGLGLLLKKKHLDSFMKAKRYKLFWTVYGEQQVFTKKYQYRSEWSGLVVIKNNKVQGKIRRKSNDRFDSFLV